MTLTASGPSKGKVTKMLERMFPDKAGIRVKWKEEPTEETLNKKTVLAEAGDIWGLVSIIPIDYLTDNRELLIKTTENRQKAFPSTPTMRYEVFKYLLKTASTPEEIFHAVPKEWMGIIPSNKPEIRG